jgi:hypothetical protein
MVLHCFLERKFLGSKSRMVPVKGLRNPTFSRSGSETTPDSPRRNAFPTLSTSLPMQEMMPIPVIATRCITLQG